MNKQKVLAIGALALVAICFAAFGVWKGVFKTDDVYQAVKVTAQGGDPIHSLCTAYVAKNNVIIAPAATAVEVAKSAPGTEVLSPTTQEDVVTSTVSVKHDAVKAPPASLLDTPQTEGGGSAESTSMPSGAEGPAPAGGSGD